MTGLNRHTLRPLAGTAHLGQSIQDILTTPIGSRVLRRNYGSDLPLLIDAPINGETMIDVFQATAEALDIWEPRLALERVEITATVAGKLDLALTGTVNAATTRIDVTLGLAS